MDAALVILGPTASGKSALALEVARRLNGVIINADSMQLYRELEILTARPTPEDEALAPHVLYGVRSATEPSSAAWWRKAALAEMARARERGLVPILCGGTGLYLSALIHGLAAIPDPGPRARAEARGLLAELGPVALHARLATVDPATAARLRPSDSQRIARAWEVWRGTGRSLADWHSDPVEAPSEWRFFSITVDPPRPALRAAIAARFAAMLAGGAVDEVRRLMSLDLDPALPAMRAQGVREIGAHLRGEITSEEASQRAVQATGRYAKRQVTWFRHHPLATPDQTFIIHSRIEGRAQFSECFRRALLQFIRAPG